MVCYQHVGQTKHRINDATEKLTKADTARLHERYTQVGRYVSSQNSNTAFQEELLM